MANPGQQVPKELVQPCASVSGLAPTSQKAGLEAEGDLFLEQERGCRAEMGGIAASKCIQLIPNPCVAVLPLLFRLLPTVHHSLHAVTLTNSLSSWPGSDFSLKD